MKQEFNLKFLPTALYLRVCVWTQVQRGTHSIHYFPMCCSVPKTLQASELGHCSKCFTKPREICGDNWTRVSAFTT